LKSREERIWRLMAARLRSARGVVLLEFGVFAPLVIMAIVFFSDFLRVLYCEQQLEIASRALCDIEAHLKPGLRTNKQTPEKFRTYQAGRDTHDVSGCPDKRGQIVIFNYLEETLGCDSTLDMLTQFSDGPGIYPRGYYYNQSGILHDALNLFCDPDSLGNTLKAECDNGMADFFTILASIFDAVVDFMTFRTDRYLTDVFPTDKVVAVSLSVMVNPTFNLFRNNAPAMGLFCREPTLTDCNGSVIPMYERDWDRSDGERRVRYYYQMPSFDTAPLAPDTYGRHMASVFTRWVKE